jgi:hypothetical protein
MMAAYPATAAPQSSLWGPLFSHHLFSLLACRVHLALLVPLAKMALMESLAPSGLLVPVDAQAKLALL